MRLFPSHDRGGYDAARPEASVEEEYAIRLRQYRSLDTFWFTSTAGAAAAVGTIAGGTLWREENNLIQAEVGDSVFLDGAKYSPTLAVHPAESVVEIRQCYTEADGVVATKKSINQFRDDTALCPSILNRLLTYSGTLLRSGGAPRAGGDSTTLDRNNILSWGGLTGYAPEQFRVSDSTPLGSQQDEVIHALRA